MIDMHNWIMYDVINIMQEVVHMERVREMIQNQLEFMAMAEDEEKNAERVSITMPHIDNRRTEYAAKYLGMSKSAFIASVVNAALGDFEEETGILKDTKYFAQYYNYMAGSKPLGDYDKFIAAQLNGEKSENEK